MTASRTDFLKEYSDRVKMVMSALQEAAKIFRNNRRDSIEVISKMYNLSEEDCRDWLDKIQYSTNGADFIRLIRTYY